MNAMRRLVQSSVAGLVVAACSSGTSPPGRPDTGAPAMSLGAFCDAFMAADTKLLSRCVGGAESIWATALLPQFSCSSLAAAVSAGRAVYDPSKVSRCLAAYPTLSCTDLEIGPSECGGPLRGTVTEGGSCLGDGDCGAASYCSGVGHGNASCKGKCAPLVPAGHSCMATQECAIGYICGGNPANMTCISELHPLAGLGASCAPVALTKPSIECGPGLSCKRTGAICATTVAEGAACTPGEGLCVTFTHCDSSSHTCKADPANGGLCGSAPSGELMRCLPGSYCKLPTPTSQTGTCAALGVGGAPCTAYFECASDSCSSPSGGTCSTPCTQE